MYSNPPGDEKTKKTVVASVALGEEMVVKLTRRLRSKLAIAKTQVNLNGKERFNRSYDGLPLQFVLLVLKWDINISSAWWVAKFYYCSLY